MLLYKRLTAVAILAFTVTLTCVAQAEDQTIYVSNEVSGAITQINNGVGSLFYSGPLLHFNNPTFLTTDSTGNVYAATNSSGGENQTIHGTIAKFASGGIGTLFATGPDFATGLALDGAGNLFATGQSGQILKYNSSGAQVQFTVNFSANLHNPYGLVIDGAGNLYVANASASFGAQNIVAVPTSGPNSGDVTNFATLPNGPPIGLAFDSAGNLYASVTSDGDIDKISSGGAVTVFASGLDMPYGLVVDALGNLIVANYGNDAIDEIPTTGPDAGQPTQIYQGDAGGAATGDFGIALSPFEPGAAGTPEPGGLALLTGIALTGLSVMARQRRKSDESPKSITDPL